MKTEVKFKIEYDGPECDPAEILTKWQQLLMHYILDQGYVPTSSYPVLGHIQIFPEKRSGLRALIGSLFWK